MINFKTAFKSPKQPRRTLQVFLGLRNKKIYSICLAGAIALLVIVVFLSSPFFEVAEVRTSGFSKTPDFDYFDFKGRNIFSISIREAKREILKDPYIKDAIITKEYPRAIKITVSERTPLAYIQYSEDVFLYIDDEGVALTAGISDYAPIVTGLSFDSFEIGKQVSGAGYAIELLNLFAKNNLEVSKIEFTESGFNFYAQNLRFLVTGRNSVPEELEFKIKKAKKIKEALGDIKALVDLETDIVSKAN